MISLASYKIIMRGMFRDEGFKLLLMTLVCRLKFEFHLKCLYFIIAEEAARHEHFSHPEEILV